MVSYPLNYPSNNLVEGKKYFVFQLICIDLKNTGYAFNGYLLISFNKLS